MASLCYRHVELKIKLLYIRFGEVAWLRIVLSTDLSVSALSGVFD